jgi:hypothetical protein
MRKCTLQKYSHKIISHVIWRLSPFDINCSIFLRKFANIKNLMKKLLYLCTIIMLTCTSCRYEEPSFSLQKPENRLVGYWLLQETQKNGVIVDTSMYDANVPHMNYYSFSYYGPLSVTSFINGSTVESKSGSWNLVDKNKNIEIFLILYNKTYNYKAEIIKLSKKELKYRYTDPRGDEWSLHLFKR